MSFNIEALEHERDELLKVLDSRALDPVSKEYMEIRKAYGDLDTRCREWRKLEADLLKLQYEEKKLALEYETESKKLEQDTEIKKEQIKVENRKCDSSEKVSKLAMIGTISAAALSAVSTIGSNFMRYKMGSDVIKDTTRTAFELDQDKVQSRVASDTTKKGLDFFFNR